MLAACTGSADPQPTTSSATTSTASSASTTTVTEVTPTTPPIDAPTLAEEAADLILYGGHVITVDEDFSIAQAVAVSDGQIEAVGLTDDIVAMAGDDTVMVDLDGRTLMPGLVDPHTHLMQFPAPDLAGMRAGQDQLLAAGVTTAGMPSVLPDHLAAFRELDAAGEILVRSHLYLAYNFVCGGRDLGDFYLSEDFDRNPDLRLAVSGVKVFTDGGACNAPAVSFEYPDSVPEGLQNAGWTGNGQLYVTPDEIATVLSTVDAAGGNTVIHAIGDVAIATALQGIRDAGELANPPQMHHNSMTSLVDPDLLAIYGQAGITPVVFTQKWANACEEGRGYLWASIIPDPALSTLEYRTAMGEANPGIRFSWHGDAPSVSGTPLQLMFPLVTGGHTDGVEVCYPAEWVDVPTVSATEAIRMVTINAAAAMGFEETFGSIEVGKEADLVILENDPLDDDPVVGLATNFVVATIIKGEVVFCRGSVCGQFEEETEVVVPAGECVAPPPGLMAWWPAEGNADDIVGGNHGKPVDGSSFDVGLVGQAFRVDGGSIALGSQPQLGDRFTIEVWVRLEGRGLSDYRSVFNNDQMFLRKDDQMEGDKFSIFIRLANGSVEPRAQSVTLAAADTWTHLAGTWDGSELRIYVNGVLEGVSERSGSLAETTTPAQIGRGEQADVEGPVFNGLIDELSMYDNALSPQDIAAIFTAGNGGKCQG